MIIIIAILSSLSGCGRRPPLPAPEVGCVDYMKLLAAHPATIELNELQAQLGFITGKSKTFSVALIPSGVDSAAAEMQLKEVFFRQEILAKTREAQSLVALRQQEEQSTLKDFVENDLSKRISDDDAKAMQLNAEITALPMDEARKADLKKQIEQLFAEDDQRKAMIFNAKKQAAMQSVNEYAVKVRSDLDIFAAGLRAEVAASYNGLVGSGNITLGLNQQPFSDAKKVADSEISAITKHISELKARIDKDIRDSIAAVAKEHGLAIVIGKPIANVSCLEITDLVKEKLIHR